MESTPFRRFIISASAATKKCRKRKRFLILTLHFGQRIRNLLKPKVVENLNKCTDKITLLSGDQSYHLFDSSANDKFFTDVVKDTKYHIIGGMFGGPKSLVINLINEYQIALDKMIEFDVLHREEQLLSYLFMKDKDSYNQLIFTTWHHEDSDMAQYNIENEIYFYNIFENLNK